MDSLKSIAAHGKFMRLRLDKSQDPAERTRIQGSLDALSQQYRDERAKICRDENRMAAAREICPDKSFNSGVSGIETGALTTPCFTGKGVNAMSQDNSAKHEKCRYAKISPKGQLFRDGYDARSQGKRPMDCPGVADGQLMGEDAAGNAKAWLEGWQARDDEIPRPGPPPMEPLEEEAQPAKTSEQDCPY